MFNKRSDMTLAIDLAVEAVRVLEVKSQKGGRQVCAIASQAVEPGAIETLPERQLAALKALLAANRFKTKTCVAAIPTTLAVTRSVAIDASKAQTPEEQIRAALQNCLPFDIKDLMFDYWPVSEPRPNARTHELLVVATRKSVVKQFLDGFGELGLTCTHLDVAPCAVASLIANATGAADAMAGTVVLGETTGYFAIIDRKRVLFWRPFDLPSAAQKAISAVQTGLDRVGDEISKCVSHMVGSMHLDNLTELLVYGHGSNDVVFTDYLTHRFHLPVRAPSPFDSFSSQAFPDTLRSELEEGVATHFAAVAGLALQPAGGLNHG
jgi:Tfp pilus assembly PilM family ATPase